MTEENEPRLGYQYRLQYLDSQNNSIKSITLQWDYEVCHMPEQTVALQVDEDDRDLYGYVSTGAVKIGTAHMDDELQISINDGVVLEEEEFLEKGLLFVE